MPRFKIERSAYEPVIIEVEGLPTLESVPLTERIKEEISNLAAKQKGKEITDEQMIEGQFATFFGLDAAATAAFPAEVKERAVILAMSTFAARTKSALQPLETMTVAKAVAPPAAIPSTTPAPPKKEEPEKNVSAPGSKPTP
ncbi:MAG: hypothetical protein WC329_05130 [Candidatus Omnitrophota bacterium]|jgi:hypothetical protein